MPRPRTSQRAEQRELRDKMRGRGMSHRQIALEFARRYRYRPRAAWRHAHGLSLTEAAEQINAFAVKAGLGHGLTTVAMTASHLCEMEGWPGTDGSGPPSGRRPTPYLLSLLASVYGCTTADLLDSADFQHLRLADRITLGGALPADARETTPDMAAREDRLPHAAAGSQRIASPLPATDDRRAAVFEVAEADVAATAVDTGRRELVGLVAVAVLGAIGSSLARSHLPGESNDEYQDSPAMNPPLTDRHPVTITELHRLLNGAKADYQACRYSALAAALPRLISGGESVSGSGSGDERRRASALLAAAYHVAASLLLKLGDQSLAWVMADRSMRAAEASGDLLAAGSSSRILTHVLLATGRGEDAVRFATTAAHQFDGRLSRPGPASLSVYGSLLLRGAVAAASIDNRPAALGFLEEAGEAARRLGEDGNHYWTAFGPVNLQIHKVHIAAKLGDAGTALAYAAAVNPGRIAVPERKASFWIDVAHARLQRRQADQALAALLAAAECAPEEARNRPDVHALVADMRARPVRPSGLESFAARVSAVAT